MHIPHVSLISATQWLVVRPFKCSSLQCKVSEKGTHSTAVLRQTTRRAAPRLLVTFSFWLFCFSFLCDDAILSSFECTRVTQRLRTRLQCKHFGVVCAYNDYKSINRMCHTCLPAVYSVFIIILCQFSWRRVINALTFFECEFSIVSTRVYYFLIITKVVWTRLTSRRIGD